MTPEEQTRKFIAERLEKNQIGELSENELWQFCFGDSYVLGTICYSYSVGVS